MQDSAAKQYFDFLMGQPDRYGYLASLPTSAEPVLETEWLEFKGYYQQEELKSLRPIWSECLSAFANTEGGVLVWGLKANRKDGRDCVNGLAEVAAPDAWKQKLKGWLLQAADPPVGGVVIETVKHATEDKGFVVCLVPEGLAKPHRAEFVENKPYLIRTGDSSVIPNPSLLRSLFFPQPRKDLAVELRSDWTTARRGGGYITDATVSIRNNGDSSAKDVFIRLVADKPCYFSASQADVRRVDGEGKGTEFSCQLSEPLHPGTRVCVVNFESMDRELRLQVGVYQTDCRPLGVWMVVDPVHVPNGEVKLSPFDGNIPP